MKILVIEDEAKLARFLKKGLEEEGYAVDAAFDGEEGEYYWQTFPYDLVVLDLRLPKKDGLTLLSDRRKNGDTTPVLILSAKGSVEERVEGLDSGSDDYLVKPFSFEELLARVRALIRRGSTTGAPKIEVDGLVIDPVTRKVTREGREILLTPKEYSLLLYLAHNPGRILTRSMILDHVWDTQSDVISNVIDVYINHLRQKVDLGYDRPLIRTVKGVGYILEVRR